MNDFQILDTERVILEGTLEAICEVRSHPQQSSLLLLNIKRGSDEEGLLKYRINALVYPDSIGHTVQVIGFYPFGSDTDKVEKFWQSGETSISHPKVAFFDTVLERWYK